MKINGRAKEVAVKEDNKKIVSNDSGERVSINDLINKILPLIRGKLHNYNLCSEKTRIRLSKCLCHFYLGDSDNHDIDIIIILENSNSNKQSSSAIFAIEIKYEGVTCKLTLSIGKEDMILSNVTIAGSEARFNPTGVTLPLTKKDLANRNINEYVKLA